MDTENGELVVTDCVKESKFSRKELRDVYLQAFSTRGRYEEKGREGVVCLSKGTDSPDSKRS